MMQSKKADVVKFHISPDCLAMPQGFHLASRSCSAYEHTRSYPV